jgi:cytochrome c
MPSGSSPLIEVKEGAAPGVQVEKSERNGMNPKALQMRLVPTLSVCVALLVGQALTAETVIGQSSPSERGQAIAEKQCARCHAVGLTGASPMGLAPPFRDLSQRYPIETLAEALAEGIVTGHPAMPHFTFHPREIDALLTYIDGLARLREPQVPKR